MKLDYKASKFFVKDKKTGQLLPVTKEQFNLIQKKILEKSKSEKKGTKRKVYP